MPIAQKLLNPTVCESKTLREVYEYVSNVLLEGIFTLEYFWRNLPFETFPKRIDCIALWRLRRRKDELNVEFVGPSLGKFRVMTAIAVVDDQNPSDRILFADCL